MRTTFSPVQAWTIQGTSRSSIDSLAMKKVADATWSRLGGAMDLSAPGAEAVQNLGEPDGESCYALTAVMKRV
jgi:hypothetical protein